MPSRLTRGDLTSRKFCEFLRYLFIKYERIAFACHFDCTESLSYATDMTYIVEVKDLKATEKKQTPLAATNYKNYTLTSFAMVQIGLAKELNQCLKSLVREESTWASEQLRPIHSFTNHSYVCILLMSMELILKYSKNLDRRMVLAMMQMVSNVDRLTFCTFLLSAYWSVYTEDLFDLLQQHFNHDCHGIGLDSIHPDEDLFKFGDPPAGVF